MIVFNELRITRDAKNLMIDAEVPGAGTYRECNSEVRYFLS